MALCEAAAFYKSQGKTLWDAMIDMYEKYGYIYDAITTITMKGLDGIEKIKQVMTTLRNTTLTEIAGYKVLAVRDYEKDTITDLATGAVKPTGLPKSNVLYYELSDDAWLCARPSGTEPKINFYYGVKGNSLDYAEKLSQDFAAKVQELIDSLS